LTAAVWRAKRGKLNPIPQYSSEAVEAQRIRRSQRKTIIERKASKLNERRHPFNSPHKSEMLGDQGYSSVARAAVARAHRMITSGPRNLSEKRSLTGSTPHTGLRAIQPKLQAKYTGSAMIQSTVPYDRSTMMSIETGVPAFTWPHIVSIGPGHLEPVQSLSGISISKKDHAIQLPSTTRHQGNASTSIMPITTNNAHKAPLPPFLVMARHGQKYAIGQATLPSITTLGLTMKPLAPSKETPHTNTITSRPLPTENTIQVEQTRIHNNGIANYPEHGCLTHVSFGPTQNLPTIIIDRDMSGSGRSRAQIQPD
jgi:hypothetical protein